MNKLLDELCLWHKDLNHKPDKCRTCGITEDNVFCNDYEPIPAQVQHLSQIQKFRARYPSYEGVLI